MPTDEPYTTGRGKEAQAFCRGLSCPVFSVPKYLAQLRQFLPYVPSIRTTELESLHRARDYKGMVRLIKKRMNVEVNLRIQWVSESAQVSDSMRDAPAWVGLPLEMPPYGSDEFKELRLDMYLRKSFLDQSAYDQIAIAIAHELSHIVLESIRHPLRRCEKAVDLTAMLLGFSGLYASGAHKEQQVYDTITIHGLGYLSIEEVMLAYELLTGSRAKRVPQIARAARQRDIRKAIGTLIALSAILVFVTVLPQMSMPRGAVTKPAELNSPRPDLISCDAKWFELHKSVSDYKTFIRNCMAGKHTVSGSYHESTSDPTRCCGLW